MSLALDLINAVEKKTPLEQSDYSFDIRSKSTEYQRGSAQAPPIVYSPIRQNTVDTVRAMYFRDAVDQKRSPDVATGDLSIYADRQQPDGWSKVFTVTGFPVQKSISQVTHPDDRPHPYHDVENATRDFNAARLHDDWTMSGDTECYDESADRQRVAERCRNRRHLYNDVNWQTVEAELDADKRRRYRHVTERVASPAAFASGHYARYRVDRHSPPCLQHQLATPTSRQLEELPSSAIQRRRRNECEPSVLWPHSETHESREANVPGRTFRGEDRLEYELPVRGAGCIDCTVSAAAATTEVTSMTKWVVSCRSIAPCEQHKVSDKRNYRYSTGDIDFPKITELIWILPNRPSRTRTKAPQHGQRRDSTNSSKSFGRETLSEDETVVNIEDSVESRHLRKFQTVGISKNRLPVMPRPEDRRTLPNCRTDAACCIHGTVPVRQVKLERPTCETSRQPLSDAVSRLTRPVGGIESTSAAGQDCSVEQVRDNDGPHYLVTLRNKKTSRLGDKADTLDHIRFIDDDECGVQYIGTRNTDTAAICSDFRSTSNAHSLTGGSSDGSKTESVERRVRFSFDDNDEQRTRTADSKRVCKSLRGICKYDALTKPHGTHRPEKIVDASTITAESAVDILWQNIIGLDKPERPDDTRSQCRVNTISGNSFDEIEIGARDSRPAPNRKFLHSSVESIPLGLKPRNSRGHFRGRVGSTHANETADTNVRLVSGVRRISTSTEDISTQRRVDWSKKTSEGMITDTAGISAMVNNNVVSPGDNSQRRSIKELVETFEDMTIPLFKIPTKTKN